MHTNCLLVAEIDVLQRLLDLQPTRDGDRSLQVVPLFPGNPPPVLPLPALSLLPGCAGKKHLLLKTKLLI
jgi:hypothetical protein